MSYKVIVLNIVLLIFVIVLYSVYGVLCSKLVILLWLFVALALATLLIFVLQYGIGKIIEKYSKKQEMNQTIINQTNCSGHSNTLLIREKRTRPDQDLGTILKAYKLV